MIKIYKVIILLFFISLPLTSNAHVQHYENLTSIEFNIYRNNKHIGTHISTFKKSGEQLTVESEINIEIKILGVVFLKYHTHGTEIYKDGELIKFNSRTNRKGKKKYVNLKLKNGEYVIDGSSYKGKAPVDYLLGTWWNHSIVKAKAQISATSGRIIDQKVTFLGKEIIKIGDNNYDTLHFNFFSIDKKLNTDVWYDEKTLNWVKASFKKNGDWEYELVSIK